MYASVASVASLSKKDLAKYQTYTVRPRVRQPAPLARDTNMSESRSPQKMKPKEKLIGIYDALFQVCWDDFFKNCQ